MIESKAFQIKYLKLNPVCAYKNKDDWCDGKVEIIRVTQMTDGEILVSTMCERHSILEKETAKANGFEPNGMTSIEGMVSDGSLINKENLEWAEKKVVEKVKERKDD